MIPIILAAVGGAIIGYSLREPKAPIEDKEENYPTTYEMILPKKLKSQNDNHKNLRIA